MQNAREMPQITIVRKSESEYVVTLVEENSHTVHLVTVTPTELARYAPEGTAPERLVEVSFEFLLQREPKESILRRFDLQVIERYFPEYPSELRRML